MRIGFITTLSTPTGYVGEDIRDGFNLAIKDGKLGNTPVKLEVEDDALKPANAKQSVDRMVQSGIKLYTGINFSNVLAAVQPTVMDAESGLPRTMATPTPRTASWIDSLRAGRPGEGRLSPCLPRLTAMILLLEQLLNGIQYGAFLFCLPPA